jgi:hypothetical protein
MEIKIQQFNKTNYPKQYASIHKNDYRFKEFLDCTNAELFSLESLFWQFVTKTVENSQLNKTYLDHEYLGSGWEWSVFKKSNTEVVKIPAGRFDEINAEIFLENLKVNYDLFCKYFGEYVAQTSFSRQGDINEITQQYISTQEIYIPLENPDLKVVESVSELIEIMLKMAKELEWMPDARIELEGKGFRFTNVLLDQKNSIPIFVDFSNFYDLYRLYPHRSNFELENKSLILKSAQEFVKSLLNSEDTTEAFSNLKAEIIIESPKRWKKFLEDKGLNYKFVGIEGDDHKYEDIELLKEIFLREKKKLLN